MLSKSVLLFRFAVVCAGKPDFSSLLRELDQVYLRPQGDLRLIVSHGDIAVHMLSKQADLFSNILDVLVKLQVCERTS